MADEAELEYPSFVLSPADRRRWDAAKAAAAAMFADLPATEAAAQTWSATRVLYNFDIPTDDSGRIPA